MNETIRQTRLGRMVIRKHHRRRSLRAATYSAMLHTIAATCMMTSALQLYCISLGANDFYLGLINCFVWAGAPFLLVGIGYMRRFGKRNILVFCSGIPPAVFMAVVALMPLVQKFGLLSSNAILYCLMAAMLLRSITDNIGAAGWFPILHDNIPSRITGKFFGNFRIYWQSSVLATTLLIAWFLGNDSNWWKFFIVFAVGEACFIVKIYALSQLKEKPQFQKADDTPSPLSILRYAFAMPATRYFLLYILLYNIAAFMCQPFYIKYLKILGYSEGYIVAGTSMIPLGAILTLRFWGRLADRFGDRSVFAFSHIGLVIVLGGWLLIDRNVFSAVFVFMLYGLWSAFQSANGIAQIRHMFHAVPETDQTNIVVVNTFIALSIAIAPLVSGLFLWSSSNWTIRSGILNVNHYQMLFVISSLIAIVPHSMCKKFQKDLDTPTAEVFVFIIRPLRNLFGSFISFSNYRRSRK